MTEHNVEIVFDTRERYLIEAFRQKYPDTPHEVEQLSIGDIHFKVDGTLKVVIERKTLDDLSASIMDHRWQEQKKRLGELEGIQAMYIMEGMEKSNKKGISYDTLISAMWSTIVRDKQHVFRTCNLQETALSVHLIYNKLLKHQGSGQENSAIVSQLSGNKKALYTKDNIWTAQLACIPGLSFTLAKKITNEYKSFEILYNTYIEKNRSMSFLCDIPKIGKKISQNIEDFLF